MPVESPSHRLRRAAPRVPAKHDVRAARPVSGVPFLAGLAPERKRPCVVLFVLLLLCCAGEARAYIDPGASSVALQLALAAFFAAIYAIKVYWRRLRDRIRARFSTARDDKVAVTETENGEH